MGRYDKGCCRSVNAGVGVWRCAGTTVNGAACVSPRLVMFQAQTPLQGSTSTRPTPTPHHPYSSNSITGSHLLSLPWHMSVFDAELYAASFALQYAASLSPPPGVVSLAVDNQVVLCTISRPGYHWGRLTGEQESGVPRFDSQ